MRVLTQNLWGMGGSWPDRRAALKEGLRAMRPDLIAFQEAVLDGEHDTARDLAGEGMHVVPCSPACSATETASRSRAAGRSSTSARSGSM
jgi:hypothetical protein